MSLIEQFKRDGFWQPGDSNWEKERKALWRDVKKSLDIMARSYPKLKKGMNHHKALFFTGKLDTRIKTTFSSNNSADYCRGSESFDCYLPLFVAWYHPSPEQIDWYKYWTESLARYDTTSSRFTFFTRYIDPTRLPRRNGLYSPVYGMAGGREKYWARLLNVGLDYRESYPEGSVNEFVKCARPNNICYEFSEGVMQELCMDARYFPNSPGQFFWPHFIYAMDKYPDEVFLQGKAGEVNHTLLHNTKSTLREVVRFLDRKDRSRYRPETVALVELMVRLYEQRELPDALLKLWDEAKDFQPDEDFYSCAFNVGDAWFERNNVLSVEEMRERVRQWKQI